MKLSCASWSFPACTLDEVAGIVRALGIVAMDISTRHGPGLDRREILESQEQTADRLAALGITLSSLFYRFGDSMYDRNLADPRWLRPNVEDFKKVLKLCDLAGIACVTVLPGMINHGQTRGEALARSANALKILADLAGEQGIVLTTEPHVQSYLESPRMVEDLLALVPGLQVALDYSHFICMGYTQEAVDPLILRAGAVHLRQARPGAIQTKLKHGTINFRALLAELSANDYRGYLMLECVHQEYMNALYDDVITETVQLRDLVRGHIESASSGA